VRGGRSCCASRARHGVEVDALGCANRSRVERWQAERCIVALPPFIAARVVRRGSQLGQRAVRIPRAWAMSTHATRALDPTPGRNGAELVPARSATSRHGRRRKLLLERPWTASGATSCWPSCRCRTPTCERKASRIEVTRYGHAMAIPHPGLLARIGPQRSAPDDAHRGSVVAGRLSFAHADWSGYSIFEEAFTRGHVAGAASA
jgi:hypothetical protein